MNFVKIISTRIVDSVRLIKFLRKGKDDTRECKVSAPYGIDSVPVEDMIAVYSPTQQNGRNVIIGYLNKNAIADVGELRFYSTDADGVEQNYIHLKNDGDIEIGGSTDNMVRYSDLEAAFNRLKSDHNDLVSKFLAHVHPGVTVGAGSTGVTPTLVSPSPADISGAKIEEIKTS